MTKLTKRETQDALLVILEEFDRVCRENNLRYTLAYGTLIGAVRHKGFIPWDDDVDVCMPRADYEKFIEIAEKEGTLGEHFSLSKDRGKKAAYPFVKMLDDRYRVKCSNHREVPNLYIDIFPLDGLPEDEKGIRKLYRKELTTAFFLLLCQWYTAEGIAGYLLYVVGFWLYLIGHCIGKRRIIKKLNKMALRYPFETSKMVGVHSWGRAREALPREVFEEYTELEFEGKKFMSVKNADRYLTHCYGNYMQLPPEKKRKTQHCMTVYRIED